MTEYGEERRKIRNDMQNKFNTQITNIGYKQNT